MEDKKEAFLIARVPTEMKDRLAVIAEKKGLNNSKLLREIIAAWIENNG